MKTNRLIALTVLCLVAAGCRTKTPAFSIIQPSGVGQYPVSSTNMTVAPEFSNIGDEAMHEYLLGRPAASGQQRYASDILQYPDAAWIVDVVVPDVPGVYGVASGETLPVLTYVVFPSKPGDSPNTYAFPYHEAQYGVFQDMLEPGQTPEFADSDEQYPLVLLSHGASAHGIYDVDHAQAIASHGYIVAVLFYGDDRTGEPEVANHHISYLRPLMTKVVLDSLLDSEEFGSHIDADNIGISGHSFGGFTALAVAGGPYLGNPATVHDPRIKAGVLAAPWVGGIEEGEAFFAFGPANSGLGRVTEPMLCLFGSEDWVTPSTFILPAMRQLGGPAYVVELVGQPHIFDGGSWEDRNGWEMLFFDAYLKSDLVSLAKLVNGRSMQGGNEDLQLFHYQRQAAATGDTSRGE